MKLLAIDTATEACSAALYIDGDIQQHYRLAPREHSHLILGMIDTLLSEAGLKPAQLDALAFGRGPGSFMGLRIAAGVTQGIAYAHSIPVVPVSTLAAIAAEAAAQTGAQRVLAAIDARMDEVYWGAYEVDATGQSRCQGDELVLAAERVPVPEGDGWLGAGTGWQRYETVLRARLGARVDSVVGECYPTAKAIAQLAVSRYASKQYVAATEVIPVYLRDNVARKPKTRQKTLDA